MYTLWTVAAELFRGALVIYTGKRKDVYALAEETFPPNDRSDDRFPGRVFHLLKCSKPYPDWQPYEVAVYTVPRAAVCSCVGYGRHGACKHADTMLHLVNVHKLETLG
jgi:hypothetical protein